MSDASDQVRPLTHTRQYREFETEPVSDDQLDALARVARWSGSSTNSQPWRFIITRDTSLLRRIAEIGLPQTRALRTATAALAVTLPDTDSARTSLAYDDGRVAERILVAASMLGIGAGITWVRPEVRPEICGLLGVPAGRYVRTIMAIGRPTEKEREPRSAPGQARLPLEELVSRR